MEIVLRLDKVVKSYSGNTIINHVSLSIPRGYIFGVLGSNGAGKTTLLRLINRIILPDSGDIYFAGEKLQSIHQARIGYLPEERGLYKNMGVLDNLVYLLQLKGLSSKAAISSANYWLDRLNLMHRRMSKVKELSKGMQQQVQFIATIAHNPDLIILDEPFSGLDPVNAGILEMIVTELNNKGTTIVFSTHRFEMVEEFCHFIAVVKDGQILIEGNLSDIQNDFAKNIYKIEFSQNIELELPISPSFNIIAAKNNNLEITLNSSYTTSDVLAFLSNSYDIVSFHKQKPSLKEIFLEVSSTCLTDQLNTL